MIKLYYVHALVLLAHRVHMQSSGSFLNQQNIQLSLIYENEL